MSTKAVTFAPKDPDGEPSVNDRRIGEGDRSPLELGKMRRSKGKSLNGAEFSRSSTDFDGFNKKGGYQ